MNDLTNNKAPGLNRVPPNAFKAMSPKNLKVHFNFILEFCNDNLDFKEWHEGQVVPVPKSGDLSDPNNWRGVNLMYIGSKIYCSLLCKRLFSIIKSNGVKYQFGSPPGVGCQDGTNNKAPGLNRVPPNAFKAMSPKNLKVHFNFILEFCNDNLDFKEWHEGQVVPVPKSGDLSDPNNWRGVNLMYIGSKIYCSLLCKRLFSIIKSNGVKYQFGSPPGVGCQDGTFTIKTLLHTRHNHNIPTYVAFVDLIKAFDTADHTLMLQILKKYGAPPKIRSYIARM